MTNDVEMLLKNYEMISPCIGTIHNITGANPILMKIMSRSSLSKYTVALTCIALLIAH